MKDGGRIARLSHKLAEANQDGFEPPFSPLESHYTMSEQDSS